MGAWTPTLQDENGDGSSSVDEEIAIGNEKLELKHERVQRPEDPTEASVTDSEVPVMIATEMESRPSTLTLLS